MIWWMRWCEYPVRSARPRRLMPALSVGVAERGYELVLRLALRSQRLPDALSASLDGIGCLDLADAAGGVRADPTNWHRC